jgi:hypothetical protein
MGLSFPAALAAALVTTPSLLLLIYMTGAFVVGCKQGFLDAFRVAFKDARR